MTRMAWLVSQLDRLDAFMTPGDLLDRVMNLAIDSEAVLLKAILNETPQSPEDLQLKLKVGQRVMAHPLVTAPRWERRLQADSLMFSIEANS